MWKVTPEGIMIPIKVIPRAGKNNIVGWENGLLKVRIAAAPDKGDANEELISFFSSELGISKGSVFLKSGAKSRFKRICLKNIQPESVWFLMKLS